MPPLVPSSSADLPPLNKAAWDDETIWKELAKGGELSLGELLRVRVRHFTDDVDAGITQLRQRDLRGIPGPIWAQAEDGARPMRGLSALAHLVTLRNLRVNAVG